MDKYDTDLLIIGGGINGAGIAADAAARGLSVTLCEQDDLAAATSSWSSKLIHGGLRYLEQYEFKLVREALAEREVLMRKAPHLIHPLEFVLPHAPHLRPAWMIRAGLFLYDHLAKRSSLPSSKKLNLHRCQEGEALLDEYHTGFRYADCQTDDARLTVLNAKAAAEHGAQILTRHKVCKLEIADGIWQAEIRREHDNHRLTLRARAVVNATGPWVTTTLNDVIAKPSENTLSLVKGSHIIIPALYPGKFAYILQNKDGRIVFAIPYLDQFTLIGTTDVPFNGNPKDAKIDPSEIDYLCDIINQYFKKKISQQDIVMGYSGVRPLFGKPGEDPSKTTREYHLELVNDSDTPPLLSIFGGKITTFRTLSEHAVNLLKPFFPAMKSSQTKDTFLPGGDLSGQTFKAFHEEMLQKYDWLDREIVSRMSNNYGGLINKVLEGCHSIESLGSDFGAGLYQHEVDYLINEEWAMTAEDILWRRSKLCLTLPKKNVTLLQKYVTTRP